MSTALGSPGLPPSLQLPSPVRGASAAGSAAGGSGPAAAAAAAAASSEEDVCEDLLLLLEILQRIADKEVIDFVGSAAAAGAGAAGSGAGSDSCGPASSALLGGLALLVPLLSGPLLCYPSLAARFMELSAHMLSSHPSQVARMDGRLFACLIDSLQSGMAHHEADVAACAMGAVRGLGLFHCAARARGPAYAALSLGPQLASMPDLFGRLARALLSLALGMGGGGAGSAAGGSSGAGGRASSSSSLRLPQALIPAASDALLACICADGAAFRGVAEELLAAAAASISPGSALSGSGAAMAARIAEELNALLSVSVQPKGSAPGTLVRVELSLDRQVRSAFAANFEAFLSRVKGATTLF